MTRTPVVGGASPRDLEDRLDEIVRACAAIERHVGMDDASELVLDAVRMRLVEIGAVVATLPADLTAVEPEIPWARLAGVGDRLTGRRRQVTESVLLWTARVDVPRLCAAVERLRGRGAGAGGPDALEEPPAPAD
ncbi:MULTISPECIES: DUF86 domain-containing protein [Curtobacterium]|uniref:Uncharacterized protein n=1 Tax=Curtobacterium oceanosedimentum TaxID=465820 RepID=A0A147DUM9_9MICO|nr:MULTISPECIES: hypothetical protein [Curtobacterium]KTR54232.1 hypothetical protein NS359_00585 [Curtobacterium oceanosedimentum]UBQ02973.1 hypothetical protein LCG91_02020 [Curtobacterium sp. TXMA1]